MTLIYISHFIIYAKPSVAGKIYSAYRNVILVCL